MTARRRPAPGWSRSSAPARRRGLDPALDQRQGRALRHGEGAARRQQGAVRTAASSLWEHTSAPEPGDEATVRAAGHEPHPGVPLHPAVDHGEVPAQRPPARLTALPRQTRLPLEHRLRRRPPVEDGTVDLAGLPQRGEVVGRAHLDVIGHVEPLDQAVGAAAQVERQHVDGLGEREAGVAEQPLGVRRLRVLVHPPPEPVVSLRAGTRCHLGEDLRDGPLRP